MPASIRSYSGRCRAFGRERLNLAIPPPLPRPGPQGDPRASGPSAGQSWLFPPQPSRSGMRMLLPDEGAVVAESAQKGYGSPGQRLRVSPLLFGLLATAGAAVTLLGVAAIRRTATVLVVLVAAWYLAIGLDRLVVAM